MTTILDFLCTLPDVSDRALDMLEASGFADLPVEWNPRLKTTAGRARFRRRPEDKVLLPYTIQLNVCLRTEGPEATKKTFLHELAHVIAGHGEGHGPRWKAICRQLGGTGERCHEYDTMQRTGNKVVGKCERCDFKVIRTRKLMAGRTYRHPKCGGKIISS
jgi:predicted SprT family Zn-dependent metalloprotease